MSSPTYGPAGVLAEGAAEFVTWKQFGAVGDGVADDAPAINACMAHAKANGLEVRASKPAVGYRIASPIDIYDGTILRGGNRVHTRVIADRTHGVVMADSPSAGGGPGHTGDWEIHNILFVGNDDTALDGDDHIGLNIERAVRFLVDRCEVRGFTNAVVIDGRTGPNGAFGVGDGKFVDCLLQIDTAKPQFNPNNAYPQDLVAFKSEQNGTGGADGVSFHNCRFYGEISTQAKLFEGDGAETDLAYGAILEGFAVTKVLTDAAHMQLDHVATAGGARDRLTAGVEYALSGAGTNTPSFDFAGGSAPLGAPAAVPLLSATGDGVTKAFRLGARPSYPASVGGRSVVARVAGVAQTPGAAYYVVDENNRTFTFTGSAANDTLTVGATGILEFLDAEGNAATGRIVRLTTTDALPAGLVVATDYYATAIDIATGAFKLAATYADAIAATPTVIDLTDAGSGAHSVTLANAIEFTAAPAASAAIAVADLNLRARWIDPNVPACVRLCRGAQRIGFFSCAFGGGRVGVDFNHARRCLIADAYFQIHEHAVSFGADATENAMVGFSSRTDATILFDFADDGSIAETNQIDAFLPKNTAVRDQFLIKESFDESDDDAGMLRKAANIVSLENRNADGFIQLKIGAKIVYGFSNNLDAHSFYNKAGGELVRISEFSGDARVSAASGKGLQMRSDNGGKNVTLSTAGGFYPGLNGSQDLGLASRRWSTVFAATGAIDTSDAGLKQDVRALTAAEAAVALRLCDLARIFRFVSAVAEKGAGARLHAGVLAQDVAAAFAAEGLDAAAYGVWCFDAWYEDAEGALYDAPGEGRVLKEMQGVRYAELYAFMMSALATLL